MAKCTSDRSFQIYGASLAKLGPKCSVDLYTEVAKCGTSSNTPSDQFGLNSVINIMSRFKKR